MMQPDTITPPATNLSSIGKAAPTRYIPLTAWQIERMQAPLTPTRRKLEPEALAWWAVIAVSSAAIWFALAAQLFS